MNGEFEVSELNPKLKEYIRGFDPYFRSLLIAGYNRKYKENYSDTAEDFLELIKKLIKFIGDDKKEREYFDNFFEEGKIGSQHVRQRIMDFILLYEFLSLYKLSKMVPRGISGKAFELVVDSILEWKLEGSNLAYEFVGSKPDFVIIDKQGNKWVAGVECKVVIHYDPSGRDVFSHKNYIQKYRDLCKCCEREKVELIGVLGGGLYNNRSSSQEIRGRMERIRQEMQKAGWQNVYFFWDAPNKELKLHASFYEFINYVGKLAEEVT